MPLMSQPVRMNSAASQSSSSGCEGDSPCEPKSSTVLTRPMPKNICRKRFTVTRGSPLPYSEYTNERRGILWVKAHREGLYRARHGQSAKAEQCRHEVDRIYQRRLPTGFGNVDQTIQQLRKVGADPNVRLWKYRGNRG